MALLSGLGSDMLIRKKLLSSLLTVVLVLSFIGSSLVFAESVNEAGDELQASEGEFQAIEDENDTPFYSADETDPPGLVDDEPAILDEENLDEGVLDEETLNEEALDEGEDNGIWVDPADVIEFVYLDEKIVALGQEQNIAFGLFDEDAVITQAEIFFEKTDTGEMASYPATVMVDNAALFTIIFTENDEATAYRLVEIAYFLADTEELYRADFSVISEEQEGGSYLFDVVSPELFGVLSSSSAEAGEVTAFAITDDGEFVAADGIEEALLIADSEGIDDVLAGQSVVSQEPVLTPGQADEPKAEGLSALAAEISSAMASYVVPLMPTAVSTARENYLIVALDPGHGGTDPGTSGNGMIEKDLNWKITNACYNELLRYTGVSPVLIRTENENPSVSVRVNRAVAYGADVFISFHINAGGGAGGAEVWIPNTSSYLYSQTHGAGEQLGNKILSQLSSLGLNNRGLKMSNTTDNEKYPDGSTADYFTAINASRFAGIPGIIIEHAFIDVTNDANKLKDDAFLTNLGKADTKAIVEQYNLLTHDAVQGSSWLKYRSYIGTLGWETYVYDQKVSGTVGKSKGIQAFDIQLLNQPVAGSIRYNTYVTGSGWQGWKNAGETAGTASGSTTIQALQIELTGTMASSYDIYYRVHVAYIGWLGWAKNGAYAGSTGYNYNAEAFQVVIVPKNAAAPGSTDSPFRGTTPGSSVTYRAHVQDVGWQNPAKDGATAGTTGRGLRMEAIEISFASKLYAGGISYNAHCANLGWQGWKSDGQQAGTTNQARQVEAIQIKLTGAMADYYDVYYRAHVQNFGWLGWAKNGASAGSAGYGYRMEALEIILVSKGGTAPGSTVGASRQTSLVLYQAHVATIGWQNRVADGATAGTTGRGLQMEALMVSLSDQQYTGGIEYNAYLFGNVWQGWKSNGAIAGTTGQSRQMEAIQIRLTGAMADYYDVYYRVHSANYGWLGWAKNGESAGTTGYNYRMEALEIRLVLKGEAAPGSTGGALRSASGTLIMGSPSTNVAQMVRRYNATGNTYPSSVYTSKGAATIQEFCQILYEEAIAEGVKPEVLFCQAMKETGWLQFGGAVQVGQCNFGGIGAVDGNPTGAATFGSVREGLRAQVQHLKAYAVPGLTTSGLNYPCVDPRFDLVTKGSATTVEALSGKWASSLTYGVEIVIMINQLYLA